MSGAFDADAFDNGAFYTGTTPPEPPPVGGTRPITLSIPLVEDDETLDLLAALLRHRLRL